MLGVLVVILAATATVVDKWASLRWLWLALIVAGMLVGAPAALLASPWWQDRQATRRAQEAEAAARARQRARDRRDHFDPRGRGVLPFGGRQGWYFTGRVRALRELAGWLAAAPDGQPAIRVVTGAPGSGKSAVLGRLVLLADPDRRQAALKADAALDPASLPPEGSIEASVHARGRTPLEVVGAIAAAVGGQAASVEDLLHALRARTDPAVVVVDAVDEASGAEELAEVLVRLAQTGGMRLLVGARRHLVDRLVAPEQALDLDDPAYVDAEDMTGYVRRCLLLEGDPQAPTPYRDRPELAGQIAQAVAAQAGGSFLVAQLVSLALVDSRRVVEVAEPGWAEQFPREVGTAMRAYLDGFGADRASVRDLLVPLAFAEGDGLTDEAVWAALASEFGTARYQPHDVRWLLADTSAPNLLQPTRGHGGSTSWRLFHTALAEYLREHETRLPGQEVQRRITQVLIDQVRSIQPRADRQGPDWLAASPYVRTHLATHAAKAGQLDGLVEDVRFLVAADSDRLLAALRAVRTPAGLRGRRVYRSAVHQLRGRPPADGACYLELHARQLGKDDFADRVAHAGLDRPWSVRWAHCNSSLAARIFGRLGGEVQSIAVGSLGGRPVVLAGGEDNIIGGLGWMRAWDLERGTPVGQPIDDLDSKALSVAVGQIGNRAMAIAAGIGLSAGSSTTQRWTRYGWVEAWDLEHGTLLSRLVDGLEDVEELAVGLFGERAVVVAAGDGARRAQWVRAWDVQTDLPIGQPIICPAGQVHSLVVTELDGRPIVAAGGSTEHVGWVRAWDLLSGTPAGGVIDDLGGDVRAVAVGEPDGRAVIIAGGDTLGSNVWMRAWDLDSTTPITQPAIRLQGSVTALAVATLDGQPAVVAGSHIGEIWVWPLEPGGPADETAIRLEGGVNALAVTTLDNQPVVVVGMQDATVRAWTLERGPHASRPNDDLGEVHAVTIGMVAGHQVVAAGGSNHFYSNWVRAWELEQNAPLGPAVPGPEGWIGSVGVGVVGARPTIGAAGGFAEIADETRFINTVGTWDLERGTPTGQPIDGLHLSKVRVMVLSTLAGNRLVLATATKDEASSTTQVSVWDLERGTPIGQPIHDLNSDINTMTVGELDGRSIIAVAGGAFGQNGWAQVRDLEHGRLAGKAAIASERPIERVALAELDGGAVLVAVGGGAFRTDDGWVQSWDIEQGTPVGQAIEGLEGEVRSVAVSSLGGRPVAIAGTSDGFIYVCDLAEGTVRRVIDVYSRVNSVAFGPQGTFATGTAMGLAVLRLM